MPAQILLEITSLVHVLKEGQLEIYDIMKYFIPNRHKETKNNKSDREQYISFELYIYVLPFTQRQTQTAEFYDLTSKNCSSHNLGIVTSVVEGSRPLTEHQSTVSLDVNYSVSESVGE